MENQIVWVDVPVRDLDRAVAFYSALLAAPIEKTVFPGFEFALFPGADTHVSGCLYFAEEDKPSASGPLVYFNVSGRLNAAAEAAAANGGTVLKPPHAIGPHGFRAVLLDTEGNRIAIHSPTP